MHYLNEISFWEDLINKELYGISPLLKSGGHTWEEISTTNLFLSDGRMIKFICDFDNIFETNDGECFYNYNIDIEMLDDESGKLNGDIRVMNKVINSIKVYGRKIPLELTSYFKNAEIKTNDLFLFSFSDKTKLMVAFHCFFREIKIELEDLAIKEYFNVYSSYEYELLFTI